MNNKETLIKTLRGSVAQLNELSDMTEGIDVYDAAGYVDTEFLMEALSCVNTFMDASNMVITKISSLLAPDAPVDERKSQADELRIVFLNFRKYNSIRNPMLKQRNG